MWTGESVVSSQDGTYYNFYKFQKRDTTEPGTGFVRMGATNLVKIAQYSTSTSPNAWQVSESTTLAKAFSLTLGMASTAVALALN